MTHIVHIITGLQRGGAETVLVTLAKELQTYGYRQSVIFFKDGPLRAELEQLGIGTHCVKPWRLLPLVRELSPTAIHSSLWSANLIARLVGILLGVPVFCALHTVAEHSGFFRNFIDFLLPVQPQKYIAVSRTVHESYEAILPAHKIITIANGIPALAHPEWRSSGIAVSKDGRATQNVFTIGAVGRFVPVKNFDILLQAFAQLCQEYPHIRLMLVGHGPLEENLRAQAHQLCISHAVEFIINKPAQQYYAFFDCFVQPSAHEGLSIALLEAMQAGLPAIVTGINEQHVCIEHKKSGLVIEPNHLNFLCEALRDYLQDPEAAATYAHAGQQHIQKHFSAANMAQRYNELFITGISGRKDHS